MNDSPAPSPDLEMWEVMRAADPAEPAPDATPAPDTSASASAASPDPTSGVLSSMRPSAWCN